MNTAGQFSFIPIPIFNVKIFLVQTPAGFILIDSGIPLQEKRINHALYKLGINPGDIKLILLTHGHLDHIGCLEFLKRISGAELVCHHSLTQVLEGGSYEEAIPRTAGWKLFNSSVSRILAGGLKPVQPDYDYQDRFDLSKVGINGEMIHTPGHSPGSSSIYLEGGICFLGDLLREPSPGKYDTGLFYHDRDQILSSLELISALKPALIFLSHGTTMSGSELTKFLQNN